MLFGDFVICRFPFLIWSWIFFTMKFFQKNSENENKIPEKFLLLFNFFSVCSQNLQFYNDDDDDEGNPENKTKQKHPNQID